MALRVPLSWLKDYVELPEELVHNPAGLADRLTLAGLEVEALHAIGGQWERDKVVVGRLTAVEPHPNADRLCLAAVEYGPAQPLTVVTGAPNLLRFLSEPLPPSVKVPFALVGATLIDGHASDGRLLKLKAGNIRGVRSEGMVCSEKELGLSEDHEGIMLLPDDAPVGTPLADYLGDAVLEFDIKGGFAHLMCVYGVARETAALTGRPLRSEVLRTGREGSPRITPAPAFLRLEIADPELCPRYTAVLVEGIRVQPSPFWLKQRLLRAGMRPINAVVDATNYVMLELGQPIHAFDYRTLRAEDGQGTPLIRVRRARPGERMKTLDGVERLLDERMLLITDGGGPVAVAGVMGGLESEITEGTDAVLLESANFEFLNTRRTSQMLKLRTEASDRFGKRLDPELCLDAVLRCAFLIAELCGGKVRMEYGDLYPRRRTRDAIPLDPAFITRLLGIEIPRPEMTGILKALEFTVEEVPPEAPSGKRRKTLIPEHTFKAARAQADGAPLLVTPPSHRMDVTQAADLVEEVGRIHGYDRMRATLIGDEMPPQRRNLPLEGAERMRDLLTGCGLDEIITYSIVSLEDERRLHPEGKAPEEELYLRLQNPLSADRAHLRRRLLGEGLNTVRNNLRFTRRAAVFELGAVFHPAAGQTLPREPRRLCAVLTGPREPGSWLAGQAGPPFDFYDAKGVAETLLEGLEIAGVDWRFGEEPAYHPGRSAQVVRDGQALGHLGELHPRVVRAFGLPAQPVCALELDVDAMLALWREDREMIPLSSHPPVYEDLAFIVEESLPAETVRRMIAETGRPLVRDVTLFDHYKGEQVGPQRKSLAYALTYQADDRTLTDSEVAKVREKIIRRLERELKAQLRA
jgi:phenylalanyl-tRNA synthetase beta chain